MKALVFECIVLFDKNLEANQFGHFKSLRSGSIELSSGMSKFDHLSLRLFPKSIALNLLVYLSWFYIKGYFYVCKRAECGASPTQMRIRLMEPCTWCEEDQFTGESKQRYSAELDEFLYPSPKTMQNGVLISHSLHRTTGSFNP